MSVGIDQRNDGRSRDIEVVVELNCKMEIHRLYCRQDGKMGVSMYDNNSFRSAMI